MANPLPPSCTAFLGADILANGAVSDVALAVKAASEKDPIASILVFDDATGAVIDLDLRGSPAEIAARLADQARPADEPAAQGASARGRGRPKLGVIAREVTLLPRHWEWLAAQPGGASQALRRLVDEARRADRGQSKQRAAQEAAYRFMAAMAGNLPGFEETARALFAGDRAGFSRHAAGWPADIRAYAHRLAWGETMAEAEGAATE